MSSSQTAAETESSAPAPEALLATYGTLVSEIAGWLELAPERLARAEALDRLEITTRLDVERVLMWSTGAVERWFAQFGDDLEIDLFLTGLDLESSRPGAALRAGHDPNGALSRFALEAETAMNGQDRDSDVEVRLSISKTRAVAALHAWLSNRLECPGSPELMAATTVFVFYQGSSLEKLLRMGALPEWERYGLAQSEGRSVVALCDSSGYLAGMSLEILGARQVTPPHWLAFSRTAWRQYLERCHAVRELQREESSWPGAPRILTPAHLQLIEYVPGLEAVALQIREMEAALSACYLANSITGETNRELRLRFAGPRPAFCHIAAPNSSPGDRESGPTALSNGGLVRLASWAYHHTSADKLVIARECLARELPAGREVTLDGLEEAAIGSLEAAKANLTLYLRGNAEHYFQLRQQALELVAGYASTVRRAVSDLTDDVVQNVYRTIGLLIGVIIAGLIQPKLAVAVEQIAASIYIAYLLFLVYYLLASQRQRFELEANDLQTRLGAMMELSEHERSLLRAEAGGADQHFWQYFRRSRFIYLTLAAASALYLFLLFTPLATHLPLSATLGVLPAATP